MKYLVIGHSWVRRLADLDLDECDGLKFVCKGGATFTSIIGEVEKFFATPGWEIPKKIFVFLGSNDLDNLVGVEEVYKVTDACEAFCSLLGQLSPGSRLVVSQVEDRYARNHLKKFGGRSEKI